MCIILLVCTLEFGKEEEQIIEADNRNLEDSITPVDVKTLEMLLSEAQYDEEKSKYLCD